MSKDLVSPTLEIQLAKKSVYNHNKQTIDNFAGSLFSQFSGSLFPNFSKCWEIQLVSTCLASKQQNYCRVFVFSLFRVFVFRLFKMLGNTAADAMVRKFLYLEDES